MTKNFPFLPEREKIETFNTNFSPKLVLNKQFFAFLILWAWVAFVSSYDAYLTVRLRSVIHDSEQNPIARFIMSMDNWDVSLFIGFKMYGTILVLGFLSLMYLVNKKYAFTTVIALALFQTGLLLYLLYDLKEGFSLEFL